MTQPEQSPVGQIIAETRARVVAEMKLTPNLNKALAAVQAKLPTFAVEDQREVTVEHKDGTSHSYKYVTLGRVIEVCTPILAEHGFSFRSMPGYGDPGDGKIAMALRYTLAHESGEEVSGMFPLKVESGIQAMGSAITYARRYCLAAVLNIAVEQDDDAMAASLADGEQPGGVRARTSRTTREPAQSNRRSTNATAADNLPGGDAAEVPRRMVNHMFGVLTSAGVPTDRDGRMGWLSQAVGRKLDSSKDMTREEVQSVIDMCEQRIAEQAVPADAQPTEGNGE